MDLSLLIDELHNHFEMTESKPYIFWRQNTPEEIEANRQRRKDLKRKIADRRTASRSPDPAKRTRSRSPSPDIGPKITAKIEPSGLYDRSDEEESISD